MPRHEAEEYGLLAPAQPVQPQRKPLNEALQAGVKSMPPSIQQSLQQSMGGLGDLAEGVLMFVGAARMIREVINS